jgi:hypothetical protein
VVELDLYAGPVLRTDPKTKTSCSHLKFLEKLVMHMTQFDGPLLCANLWDWIYTWDPHLDSDPKTKTSRSHLKILEKLAEIYVKDSI